MKTLFRVIAVWLLLLTQEVHADGFFGGGGGGGGGTGCNTSGTQVLKGDGAGGCDNASAGTDFTSPSSTETLTNKTLAAADNVIEADTGDSATGFFPGGTLENARLDTDLGALGDNATNGFWARTGAGTGAARTFAGTTNQISISNPDGVSGAPTFSIPTNPTLPGTTTGTFSGNLTGDVTGNADTATALAANPDDCGANSFANAIAADGDLTCAQPNFSDLSGTASDGQIPDLDTLSTGLPPNECVQTDGTGLFSTSGGVCGAGGGGTGVGRESLQATWTSIPDGSCQQQTDTWTGVTTSDTVIVGAPSNLAAGLIASGFVSAADTVAIRICNFSGAAVNPGASTFKATLAVYNLSGGDTLDFGSLADGSCASLTFALTGVAAGDPVAPQWPSTLEAGLFGFMVGSATDTVQVRLCNFSGAAVDPASQTFGASIAK